MIDFAGGIVRHVLDFYLIVDVLSHLGACLTRMYVGEVGVEVEVSMRDSADADAGAVVVAVAVQRIEGEVKKTRLGSKDGKDKFPFPFCS